MVFWWEEELDVYLVSHSVSWQNLNQYLHRSTPIEAFLLLPVFASPILFVRPHIPLSTRWGGPVARSITIAGRRGWEGGEGFELVTPTAPSMTLGN